MPAFELDEIEHWGEVALAIGRYNMQTPIKPGTFEVDRGKYVGHRRRMPNGQFRVTLSMCYSDRWCRVAFVGEQHFGRKMIGIQFTQPALDFWRVGTLPTGL